MSFVNTTVHALYQGDGVLTTFAIPFTPIVDDSAETVVYIRDETDPAAITETLKTEGALNDYTLTGAPDADSFNVNVVFNAGEIPTATSESVRWPHFASYSSSRYDSSRFISACYPRADI
jgi:hypothetical protein